MLQELLFLFETLQNDIYLARMIQQQCKGQLVAGQTTKVGSPHGTERLQGDNQRRWGGGG